MTTDKTGQNNQSMVGEPREKRLDTSNQSILKILEENAMWWEHASLTCERTAAHLSSGDKKEELEWLLLSAVYRERAGMHARLIIQLLGKDDWDTPKTGDSRFAQERLLA